MPHKKAKRSIRDKRTENVGHDLPPTKSALTKGRKKTTTDAFGGREDLKGLSKNAYRILNAGKMREEYNKKRKEQTKLRAELKAMPHESLRDFNRRVEQTLKGGIIAAVKSSRPPKVDPLKKEKKEKKVKTVEAANDAEGADETATPASKKGGKAVAPPLDTSDYEPMTKRDKYLSEDFEGAPLRRNINDIVDAPPELTIRLKTTQPKDRIPLSDDMKTMIEMERKRAIESYREMKRQKRQDAKSE